MCDKWALPPTQQCTRVVKRIYDDASRQQCVHVIPPTCVFFVLTRFWEATWIHNDKDTVLVRLIQQHLPQHKEPSKLFTQQGGTKERKGHPRSTGTRRLNIKISKETGKPTQLKRARRSRSFSISLATSLSVVTDRPR